VALEAEPGTQWKTNQPVSGEMAKHGRAGVSGAAQGAGGDSLDAVEELEGGASGEERDRAANHDFVVCIDARDDAGEDEQDDAHAEHEARAEQDGRVAGVTCGGRIAASNGLAHADSGGGRDAERNHVSESHCIERNLVAGERHGAEPGDERGDEGEDADFGGELQSGGKTEGDKAADTLEVGLCRSFQEIGAMAVVVPEKIADENEREIAAGKGGGPAGAGDAEGGEAELAKDKNVVAEKVDEIGGDERESDGAHHVHALKGTAHGKIEKKREKANGEGAHVGSGEDGDIVIHTDALETRGDEPDGCDEERRSRKTEIDAVDERAVAVFAAAGTESLGDERVQADHKAFAEECENDEDAGTDADSTDGFGAVGEAADHHGVHDDHAHPA